MSPSPRLLARASLTLLAALATQCAAVPDADTGAAEQGITVCHSSPIVQGIDVSEFQGTINWNTVHASGRDFAIARIGDGTYTDPTFARNWAGMRAAGMVRGAYLFFRPTDSAASQADAIRSAVGRLGDGDLPVVIDVECMCPASAGTCVSSGRGCVGPSTAAAVLRALVPLVQADTGKVPIIYTGAWFWDGGSYLADAVTFPSNPLFVSGYVSGCPNTPHGWSDWRIWQYSDGTCAGCPVRDTTVPGVESSPSVDRDEFAGTLAQLQAFANGGATWGASFVSQSFPYAAAGAVTMHPGATQAESITMRNIGTHAWDSHTRLATTEPRDRTSPFAGSDWVGPNRLAAVTGSVASGSEFRFDFTLHAPMTVGHYTEHYGMVEDGVTWFSAAGEAGPPDDQLEAIIDVVPYTWAAEFVGQSFPPATGTGAGVITMHPGESLAAYIDLRNTGSHAWDTSTRLGTTEPHDRASMFADSDWVSAGRPAEVHGSIATGATYRFAFTLHAPATPGTYDEHFGVLEEGVTWFSASGEGGPADTLLEARIVVVAEGEDAGMPTDDAGNGGDAAHAEDAAQSEDAAASDAEHDAANTEDGGEQTSEDAGRIESDAGGDGSTATGAMQAGCSVRAGAPRGARSFGWMLAALGAAVAMRRGRRARRGERE